MEAKRFLKALLLPASLCALVACTSIEVKTTPYPGLQKLAATDPDKVEILRARAQPSVQIQPTIEQRRAVRR